MGGPAPPAREPTLGRRGAARVRRARLPRLFLLGQPFPAALRRPPAQLRGWAGGRRPWLGRRRERSARGTAPRDPGSGLISARGLEEAGTRALVPSCLSGFHDLSLWPEWIKGPIGCGLSEWECGAERREFRDRPLTERA